MEKGKRSGLLCVFSSPLMNNTEPVTLLNFIEEEQQLKSIAEESNIRNYKSIIATTTDLLNEIEGDFNIIHFSGHGNEEFLFFEDFEGGVDILDKDSVLEIFEDAKHLDLIVLSSCHSEKIGKILIKAGIKCVIAIKSDYAVYDRFATAFSQSFYQNLLVRRTSIKQAFNIAKKSIKLNADWKKHKAFLTEENISFIDEDKKFLLLPDNDPIEIGRASCRERV